MEISAIMNIHELAVNRTVRQGSDTQGKTEQEPAQDTTLLTAQVDMKEKDLIGAMPSIVHQQEDKNEKSHTEIPGTGNIVDVRT